MADEKDDAPAGMLGDALSPAEQAYFDSAGQNTEGLVTEGTAAAEPPKTSDDTGKPSPDGAVKPDVKVDAKVDAKPDGKADADDGDDDDDVPDAGIVTDPTKLQKTVSFYKHERIRKKLAGEVEAAKVLAAETARKLSERDIAFAKAEERLKLLAEAMTPRPADAAEQDPEPDPEKDIFGWIQWSKREMGRTRDELKAARQGVDQTQQTIEQRNAADELKSSFQRDAVTFSQTTPDFVHAYNHMFNVRGAMLEDQGYQPEQIRGIIAREERELVQRAVQAGKSPAEMIYAMAQRFGYQKAAPQAGDATGAAAAAVEAKPNGNGAAAAAAPAKPSVTEEIARIKAGQEAGKTLSSAGGAANELSVEGLVNMSEQEFAALLRKSPNKVNALMGAA